MVMGTITEAKAFELKGNMVTLPILYLNLSDFTLFDQQLQAVVAQSPRMFQQSPLIIDLSHILAGESIDFPRLLRALRSHAIVPVGIRNGSVEQQAAAKCAGLGIIAPGQGKKKSEPKKLAETAMIIHKPVRSGQQIYAKNRDLVILGSVSSAAEVMADGNIMVYGALNGKALAGVSGNENARIFCSVLSADLIAVAGHYKLRDSLEEQVVPQSPYGIQVFLDKQHLCIQKI